jgi:hypothetical protein
MGQIELSVSCEICKKPPCEQESRRRSWSRKAMATARSRRRSHRPTPCCMGSSSPSAEARELPHAGEAKMRAKITEARDVAAARRCRAGQRWWTAPQDSKSMP